MYTGSSLIYFKKEEALLLLDLQQKKIYWVNVKVSVHKDQQMSIKLRPTVKVQGQIYAKIVIVILKTMNAYYKFKYLNCDA